MLKSQECKGSCWLQVFTKSGVVYKKDPKAEWCACTLSPCRTCKDEVPFLPEGGTCNNCYTKQENEQYATRYRAYRKARAKNYFKKKTQARCKHRWEYHTDSISEWFKCNKCYKVDFSRDYAL